jgi:putative DNA primase/helicase
MLLSSGFFPSAAEDTLTIDRKYKDHWTGKLPTRLHIISNELPKLGDASAAIVDRFVLLLLSRSWLGKEDTELEARIQQELTRILNWSLDGLYRLTVTNENRFTFLESADEAIVAMRDLASPVGAFVRERCVVGPDKQVAVDEIYKARTGPRRMSSQNRPTLRLSFAFSPHCQPAGLPQDRA